ncbi:hypothetical protein [Pelomonas sp. KK5]|uniref:hypothetical protein n=1 Tax=Pelomonas sp. KK5 TaxID=1855730 RepID=UPI00097BA911|nr:hypothetical protein [Pelomonas sp. KK5]
MNATAAQTRLAHQDARDRRQARDRRRMARTVAGGRAALPVGLPAADGMPRGARRRPAALMFGIVMVLATWLLAGIMRLSGAEGGDLLTLLATGMTLSLAVLAWLERRPSGPSAT